MAQIGTDADTAPAPAVRVGRIVAVSVRTRRRDTPGQRLDGAEHAPAIHAGLADALDGGLVGDEIG